MRRIERDSMQIEHYIAQHPADKDYDAALTIDYDNLLGVCSGNKGHKKKYLTCDQSRGNAHLTVNPLRLDSIRQIKYSSNGKIFSNNEAIDYDLKKVLNLNLDCAGVQLVSNRKAALDSLKCYINKACKGKAATGVQLRRIMENLNGDGHRSEYLGILNDYLQHKINALSL